MKETAELTYHFIPAKCMDRLSLELGAPVSTKMQQVQNPEPLSVRFSCVSPWMLLNLSLVAAGILLTLLEHPPSPVSVPAKALIPDHDPPQPIITGVDNVLEGNGYVPVLQFGGDHGLGSPPRVLWLSDLPPAYPRPLFGGTY